MIAALLGDIWPYIAGAVTLLLGALGLYAKGRSDANHAADRKADKDALQTHERITNAPKSDTPDDARAWLDGHARRLRDGRKP